MACEIFNSQANLFIGFEDFFDFGAGVQDGGVVSSAEVTADFLQTVASKLSAQIHTDLPGQGDALASFFALEVCNADIEFPADGFDDVGHGDGSLSGGLLNAERLAGQFRSNGLADGSGGGIQNRQGAFDFTNVRLDVFRNHFCNALGQVNAAKAGLLFDDGDAGFITGRIQPCNQSPLKAADETLFE